MKRSLNAELAALQLKAPAEPWPLFREGQEFVFTPFVERPEGFCDWAWSDIQKDTHAGITGGENLG